jgi:site-specific DNA-adenine methylase
MTGTFNRYNGKIFDWADQVRLAADAWKAHARGVTVIVSNASDPAVYQLYSGADVRILERPSLVSRTRAGRGIVSESLFVLPT